MSPAVTSAAGSTNAGTPYMPGMSPAVTSAAGSSAAATPVQRGRAKTNAANAFGGAGARSKANQNNKGTPSRIQKQNAVPREDPAPAVKPDFDLDAIYENSVVAATSAQDADAVDEDPDADADVDSLLNPDLSPAVNISNSSNANAADAVVTKSGNVADASNVNKW